MFLLPRPLYTSTQVERSGQVSVPNEQRLKPYEGSPEAAGQAPPLLEPARQPISRGRVAWPREWEIPIQDPVEPDQTRAPPPPPPGPPVAPAPGPVPAPEGTYQAERGDPRTPAPITPSPQPKAPMGLERQARSRRPPGYLADYHVGPVDLAPQGQNSPSIGSNPHSYGPRYPPRDTTIEFTYRGSADSDRVELPHRSSSWNMTEHVSSARGNFPTRGSATFTPVSESTARTLSNSNSNLNSTLQEMGNPLTDLTTSQNNSGMITQGH